ncbi:MAG TPA: hypothetical protein VIZ87_08570 [Terrimicrobium sp.]
MSIFVSDAGVGTRTAVSDFMRRDEVKTIFSVYHIWLQEGRDAIMAQRPEQARVAQMVHRRMKSSSRREAAEQFFTPSPAPSFFAT